MPSIYTFSCSKCTFALPSGWGGGTYVLDEAGSMISCPHPVENSRIAAVLGVPIEQIYSGMAMILRHKEPNWWWSTKKRQLFEQLTSRTGRFEWCVCESCLSTFRLDLERHPRICSECQGIHVFTIFETVGRPCLSCKAGTMIAHDTGAIA